jgi:hypothetical protein
VRRGQQCIFTPVSPCSASSIATREFQADPKEHVAQGIHFVQSNDFGGEFGHEFRQINFGNEICCPMYLCPESVIARHAVFSLLLMPAKLCVQCGFDRCGGRLYWFPHSKPPSVLKWL